jgi:hypothetical protein
MSIDAALANSAELSNWLDNSIHKLQTQPYGDREWMAATLLDQVHEHHKAIQLLLKSSFTGSAFSLFRPAFETYVRGVWLLRCACDKQVEDFKKDTVKKFIGELIGEIERLPEYDVGTLSKVKREALGAMHSYTHGGYLQAVRRMTPDQIKPNYSEGEMLEVINSSDTVALLAASEIFSMARRNDLNEAALERMRGLSGS